MIGAISYIAIEASALTLSLPVMGELGLSRKMVVHGLLLTFRLNDSLP